MNHITYINVQSPGETPTKKFWWKIFWVSKNSKSQKTCSPKIIFVQMVKFGDIGANFWLWGLTFLGFHLEILHFWIFIALATFWFPKLVFGKISLLIPFILVLLEIFGVILWLLALKFIGFTLTVFKRYGSFVFSLFFLLFSFKNL